MTRIVYGSANARELRSLCFTISKLPEIKDVLSCAKSKLLVEINNNIDSLIDIETLIDAAIVEEPPISVKEGSIIKHGYDSEIDLLRGDMSSGRDIMAERQEFHILKLGTIAYLAILLKSPIHLKIKFRLIILENKHFLTAKDILQWNLKKLKVEFLVQKIELFSWSMNCFVKLEKKLQTI